MRLNNLLIPKCGFAGPIWDHLLFLMNVYLNMPNSLKLKSGQIKIDISLSEGNALFALPRFSSTVHTNIQPVGDKLRTEYIKTVWQ